MARAVTFVALGDSLTVGFIPYRLATQPYSQFLKEMTNNFLERLGKSRALEVRLINRGVNGDLTSGMLLRFKRDVIDLNPSHVIVLGGTNDIGWGLPVEDIFANLKRMLETAADNSIQPVACTVPSVLGWDQGIPPRLELNRLLKHLCRAKGTPRADLFESTSDPATKRLRPEYSSDGLHMNEAGYRRIAETLFNEAVKTLLTQALNQD